MPCTHTCVRVCRRDSCVNLGGDRTHHWDMRSGVQALGRKKHRGLRTGESLLKGLEPPALLSQEGWASSLPLPSRCGWQMSVSLSQLCAGQHREGCGHVTRETVLGLQGSPGFGCAFWCRACWLSCAGESQQALQSSSAGTPSPRLMLSGPRCLLGSHRGQAEYALDLRVHGQ